MTANELSDKYGFWLGHPQYPLDDWRHEVASNDTRLGYWEWVSGLVQQAEEDERQTAAGRAPQGG